MKSPDALAYSFGTNRGHLKNATKRLLIDAMKRRWRHYQRQKKACRSNPSEKAVHDLRTAIRRLLAVVSLAAEITGDKSRARARLNKYLKKQLDEFDELRDLTVARERVEQYLPKFPALTSFSTWLAERETAALHDLRRRHKKLLRHSTSARRQYRKIRHRLLHSKADLGQSVHISLSRALTDFRTKVSSASALQPATIHHARISLKRLRYIAEVVGPTPELPAEASLADLQTQLGQVQDLCVLASLFEDYCAGNTTVDAGDFQRYLQDEQARAAAEAIQASHEIETTDGASR